MDEYEVIKYPLATEKSIRMMESENKLVFVVSKRAGKKDIKEAIERMFKVKIADVNTLIDTRGKKRAYIKFSEETPAIDIATRLGLI